MRDYTGDGLENNGQPALEETTFLAKVSHEIRTPISAIIGMAELALYEDDAAGVQEHLLTIKHEGQRILSVVSDILSLAKMESGETAPVESDYPLSTLIYDVIDIMKPHILEARLRFIVNVDCDIPNMLGGDVARIRQIMQSLIGNALRYTDRYHLSLFVRGEIVSEDTVNLIIEVSDSGKSAEEAVNSLEGAPDKHNSANIENAGLGFAMIKSLVHSMNGQIGVTGGYGRGHTFTLTIPQTYKGGLKLATVTDPESKPVLIYERRQLCVLSIKRTMECLGVPHMIVSSASAFYEELKKNQYKFAFVASVLYDKVKKLYSEFRSNTEFVLIAEYGEAISDRNVSIITAPIFILPVANLLNGVSDRFISSLSKDVAARLTAPDARVLVVDDINTNLKVAEGLLLPYRVRVDLCKSGLEAVDLIKNNRYDLIFMDHMMPETDGIEVTAQIRVLSDAYFQTVPIIALTANTAMDTKDEYLKNGFNDYLSKPIEIEKLDAILETWLPKNKKKNLPAGAEPGDAPAAQDKGPDIEIEGVNTEKGMFWAGGTVGGYVQVLTAFYKDGVIKLEEIKTSLENKDMRLYTVHICGIKSAAATIGAEKLSEVAKILEIAGQQGDLTFIRGHNAALLTALESLLESVRKAVLER